MGYDALEKIKYSDRTNYEKVYQERYNSESSYRYDFNVNGYGAFVFVNQDILSLVSDIFILDKKLSKLKGSVPKVAVEQFRRKCLVDEIQQSNDMEGVASTRKEIKDSLENKLPNSRFNGIVNKYEHLNTDEEIPLSDCMDIRKLYDEIILDEIKASDKGNIPDGDIFRKSKVYVSDNNTGRTIHTGLYPETKIIEAMSSLLAALKNPEYNELINIAVTHYMIGYIHPFYDGNGQLSRFISSYLISEVLEEIVSYRLAYTIKQNLNAYHKIFKDTNNENNRGDLTPFTIYFLKLIKTSISELINYFDEASTTLYYFRKKLVNMNKTDDYKDVFDILIQNAMFGIEGLSIEKLSSITGKSDYIVRKNVQLIEMDNLVKKAKTRPYLYTANLDKLELFED